MYLLGFPLRFFVVLLPASRFRSSNYVSVDSLAPSNGLNMYIYIYILSMPPMASIPTSGKM